MSHTADRSAIRWLVGACLLALVVACAGCGQAADHARQRAADTRGYIGLADDALVAGDLPAARTHLRSARIATDSTLHALGAHYDPAAPPAVPTPSPISRTEPNP